MAKLNVWHIERGGALPRRDGHNLLSRYVQKLGLPVNKALDEPGTGNAVNLWPLTGQFNGFPLSNNTGYTQFTGNPTPGRVR